MLERSWPSVCILLPWLCRGATDAQNFEPAERRIAIRRLARQVRQRYDAYFLGTPPDDLNGLAGYISSVRNEILWPDLQKLSAAVVGWINLHEASRNKTGVFDGYEIDVFHEDILAYRDKLALHMSGDVANTVFAEETFNAALSLLTYITMVFGNSRRCRLLVRRQLEQAFRRVSNEDAPLTFDGAQVWDCLEVFFWGDHGIRQQLWDQVLRQDDVRMYELSETLTAQFVFRPICVLESFSVAASWRTQKYGETCFEFHSVQAIDHFFVAGVGTRARQMYRLAKYFRPPLTGGARPSLKWCSVHAAGSHYMALSTLASWPWWHANSKIHGLMDLLEQNYAIIATEREGILTEPSLRKHAYYHINHDKVEDLPAWRKLDFLDGASMLSTHLCKYAPRTCALFGYYDFAADQAVMSFPARLMWTVLEPGARLRQHSGGAERINIQMCVHGCAGATLFLNGSGIPQPQGRALAFQDSFRHAVRNDGPTSRWVFQITVAHPDLLKAYEEAGHKWYGVRARLNLRVRASTLSQLM